MQFFNDFEEALWNGAYEEAQFSLRPLRTLRTLQGREFEIVENAFVQSRRDADAEAMWNILIWLRKH